MADYFAGAALPREKVKRTIVGRLARPIVPQPIVFFLKARAFEKSRTMRGYTLLVQAPLFLG
jgi:hypothetical protein